MARRAAAGDAAPAAGGGASAGAVLLREVAAADLAVFFEHQSDPEAVAMADFPARDRDAFTAHWARILRDGTVVTRTVLADGEVAGNVVSWEQDGERDVGFWIGHEFWGRGVATRALGGLLEIVTQRPLYARAARSNTASCRVLEKCGFVVIGRATGGEPGPPDSGDAADVVLRLD